MPEEPANLLAALLEQRGWHRYTTFKSQYDRAAKTVDRALVGSWPSRAQFHRWITGQLTGLPYVDHCRVLEQMFPDWSAAQLFAPCPPDMGNPRRVAQAAVPPPVPDGRFADLAAVFTTRSDFTASVSPHKLFDGAQDIRAAGLSLNLICQQYPEQRLRHLVEAGTTLRCLFLDPEGAAIKAREREEHHLAGHLSHLTTVNIQMLSQRVRDHVSPEARDRVQLAVYDETIRFNILIVDDTCVAQPYLPDSRGVDSPTLLIHRDPTTPGLFPIFDQVFTSLWERSKPT